MRGGKPGRGGPSRIIFQLPPHAGGLCPPPRSSLRVRWSIGGKGEACKRCVCVCVCVVMQGAILSSLTCVQLHKRAEKIAAMLMERGHLQDGHHVALVYPPGTSRPTSRPPAQTASLSL